MNTQPHIAQPGSYQQRHSEVQRDISASPSSGAPCRYVIRQLKGSSTQKETLADASVSMAHERTMHADEYVNNLATEHSLSHKDVMWHGIREGGGSRSSPKRQMSSNSTTPQQLIRIANFNASSAKAKQFDGHAALAKLRSASPSSCYRPKQAVEEMKGRMQRRCDSPCSTLCAASPKHNTGEEAQCENACNRALDPTAERVEAFADCSTLLRMCCQATCRTNTGSPHIVPTVHIMTNGQRNTDEYMQSIQKEGQEALQKMVPMDQTEEFSQPLAPAEQRTQGDERVVLIHKTKTGLAAGPRMFKPKVAKEQPRRNAIGICGSVAAQQITQKQQEGKSTEELFENALALQCQKHLNEGIDVRAVFERVMAREEETSRHDLSRAAAAANFPQPATTPQSADVHDEPSGPPAWSATEMHVQFRSSWIPDRFGTEQDSLAAHHQLSPSSLASSTPAAVLANAATNLSRKKALSHSSSHDCQPPQQHDFREMNDHNFLLDMLCCRSPQPSTAPIWHPHPFSDATPLPVPVQLELTGHTTAGDSSTSGLTGALADCMPAGTSSNSPELTARDCGSQGGKGCEVHPGGLGLPLDEGEDGDLIDLLDSLDQDTWDMTNHKTEQQEGPCAEEYPSGLMQEALSTCLPTTPGSTHELPTHTGRVLDLECGEHTAAAAAAPEEWSPFRQSTEMTIMQPAHGDESDVPQDFSGDPSYQDIMFTTANAEKRLINKDMLVQVYHLPINAAAQSLGIGVTVLKKYCRQFNVGRWPFRKLCSIDKLIKTIKHESQQHPDKSATATHLLNELELCRVEIYQDPMHEIPETVKRLRQANFKNVYKHRHASRHTKEGDSGEEDGEMKDD